MKFGANKTKEEKLIEIADNFEFKPKKSGKRKFWKIAKFTSIFFLTAIVVFTTQIIISGQSSNSWISKIPILSQLKSLVESSDRKLKGEENGRINILLLGMGGKNHDGGTLTDTIILASMDTVEKKVAMISIPRDLSVPVEGMGYRKINNINAFAEMESKGSGGLATSQAVSDILNIPIDYYVRLDFQGFINIVDEAGNIDVYAENTLDDYSYPIMGREDTHPYSGRFEHLHVEQGWNKMDGELALKYVRSRHAAGAEGSDFARSRRQQKVIEAIKNKIISKNVLFKPKMITDIIGELNDHVSTNFQVWEMVKLWGMFKDTKQEDIVNKTIDNSPNGLLTDSISPEGAYILLPRNGDYSEIQYLVNNIFSKAPEESKKNVVTEKTSIEIFNGTWVSGLANHIALDLEKYGFNVARVGNFSKQNFEKSVIYDLTYGEKMDSLKILRDKTGADVNFGLPEWLISSLSETIPKEKEIKQPDFILILGRDADKTSSGAKNNLQ